MQGRLNGLPIHSYRTHINILEDGDYIHLAQLRYRDGPQLLRKVCSPGFMAFRYASSRISAGPHLHLHVADSVDTLDGEGLPFVISRYEELGRYQDIAQLGHAPWQVAQPGVRRHSQEWPTYNAVVRFK